MPIDGETVVEGKNTVEGGHAAGKRPDGCERGGTAPAARLCVSYCSDRLTSPTRLQRAEDLAVVKIMEGCGWGGGAHHAGGRARWESPASALATREPRLTPECGGVKRCGPYSHGDLKTTAFGMRSSRCPLGSQHTVAKGSGAPHEFVEGRWI